LPTINLAKISRRFNLGNYETIDVGFEAFVGEGENVQQTLALLEQEAVSYVRNAHPEIFSVKQTQQPTKMVQPTIQEQLEKIKAPFGDLADLLSFAVKNGTVVVTPRQFLGAENFAKIAAKVRELGGTYISAGKESRFEMPLRK
jgi:hypothetical protein